MGKNIWRFVLVVSLCLVLCACQKDAGRKVNLDYGKPVFYPYPSAVWRLVLGGTKDDYVKDIFCYDGYIYIIGESNSSDINFTSAIFGQKLFLGRLDFNGEIKNIWSFAASSKNRYVKSLIIDECLYVLAECELDTKSAVIYKVNLNTGQAVYKVLGSRLLEEDALDLIADGNKLYVVGQNVERYYNVRNLFIEQLDLNLKQQNFQRFVRGADLKYIGCVKNNDRLNVWVSAVAIEHSYPVMIDLTDSEYVYHNFERPFLGHKLLDAKALGDKTLLVFAKENQNSAAYCFFENGEFGALKSILKEDAANGKIIPNGDCSAVFLDAQNPSYYFVSEKYFAVINNINADLLSYKCFEDKKIAAALAKQGGRQCLLLFKDYDLKILYLETPENLTSFWIEEDYLITAGNGDSDIIITLTKALPYQFIRS
ncbi:MAG TPA: hypothetical protein VIL24_02985 [Clostridia bacterium]